MCRGKRKGRSRGGGLSNRPVNKILIGGKKSKILFLLAVFFTGFVTAIYCVSTMPNDFEGKSMEGINGHFKETLGDATCRLFKIGKESAWRFSRYVKQKIDQSKTEEYTLAK